MFAKFTTFIIFAMFTMVYLFTIFIIVTLFTISIIVKMFKIFIIVTLFTNVHNIYHRQNVPSPGHLFTRLDVLAEKCLVLASLVVRELFEFVLNRLFQLPTY